MSIRNEDRHGLANLQHERVKALDKFQIPPVILFTLVFIPFSLFLATTYKSVDDENQKQHQQNILKAVRKTQNIIEYGEDEVTGSEELTMATTQYKQVVHQKKAKE